MNVPRLISLDSAHIQIFLNDACPYLQPLGIYYLRNFLSPAELEMFTMHANIFEKTAYTIDDIPDIAF